MKLRTVLLAGAVVTAAACMADYGFKDDPGASPIDPAGMGRKKAAAPRAFYSEKELARHNSEGNCWLVIHGKVYDVTKFIPFHPGGSAILEGCGKDATRLFETRPMGSGTAHSTYARETAVKYYISDVK